MIFRRRQDEMEGFRRMREALRQQADPNDHALLDEDYEPYDDDELEDDEVILIEDELLEDEPVAEDDVDEEALDDYAPLVAEPVLPVTEAKPAEAPSAALVPSPPSERQVIVPRAHASNASMTTIGADTVWNGTLRSESNVYLEGQVEGTVEARDTIYVAERARIDARVAAHSVVISGHVCGQIDCEGRLEVTPTGRVSGEVVAGSLVVHDGAVVDGKIRMKSGSVAPSH